MTTWIRAGFLALLAALALFCARRVQWSSDITNFLPDADAADLALLARSMTQGDLARTMFLTIGVRPDPAGRGDGPGQRQDRAEATATRASDRARDEREIAAAARALAARLEDNPEVAWIRIAPDERDLEKVWKLYFPRRFALASLDPEREVPSLVSAEAIAARATAAREALASPAATLAKRTLPADPLGLFERIVGRIREESPTLEVRDGVFFSRDGYGVVMLATRASAFDSARQAPLLADIDAAWGEIGATTGGRLVLEKSGMNRFAVAAEAAMMRDIGWIGGASFLGITALTLAFFRSIRPFLVMMLPTLAGFVVPCALGVLAFDRLDGLTIAFGASLVGTTIDYPTHLLNHFSMIGGRRAETVRLLAPSISLGALTTMASFAGLGFTDFPGFRQLAFFSVIGIGSALATTLLIVPFFVDDDARPTRTAGRVARSLGQGVEWLRRHRRVLWAVPALAVVLAAAAVPVVRWEDDLSKLGAVDPALQDEETRVRERVSPLEMGRAVMVTAPDEEQALVRTEEVARRLALLRDGGAIAGFRSAADVVRSQELQRRNVAAWRAQPDLADRIVAGFAAAGFRPESFAPLRADLAAEPPPPLDLADLDGTGLDALVAPMVVGLGGKHGTISLVREPRDEDAVRRAIADLPGARYFVQRDFVNELYAEFRTANVQQILTGSLLVVAVLLARYRRWRPALASFLPALLVPLFVFPALAFSGIAINLLHVVSLVMVMGMGTDWGVFLVDSLRDPAEFEATLVSILLCGLTTVATFAVLAISEHPALRAIGITTGLSVLLSMVLAPVSLVVIERGAVDARPPRR